MIISEWNMTKTKQDKKEEKKRKKKKKKAAKYIVIQSSHQGDLRGTVWDIPDDTNMNPRRAAKTPTNFKTKLTAPGCMVRKLRKFLYMHVDRKVIKFVILCTNSIQIVYFQ